MKNKLLLLLITASIFILVLPCCAQTASNQDICISDVRLSDYINPFIGASTSIGAAGVHHGLGKTFPGATTPFGMVQVSPNTITGGDNSPGYSYEHQTIEGFPFTQMSGVGWYGDLGNFLVMPTTGELQIIAGKENGSIKGYRSKFSKETETAKAGYYSVELTDYNIKVEATAAPRSGMFRFTYPENKQSRIQIDLARRVGGTSTSQYIKVEDDYTIRGWMECTPEGGGWGNGAGKADYTVYFYARFSKPLKNYAFWSANIPDDWARRREEVGSMNYLNRVAESSIIKGDKELKGKHLGFFTEFETKKDEEVLLKVGISFVSMEGAEKNFKSEIQNKSFDQVYQQTRQLWDEALRKISVCGGSSDEKTIFYTSLYHTMIDPRTYTDVDGQYVGGDKKIHKSGNFTKRTIFSGWDVFRSQFPLQTIINREVVNDMINSLITLADESGKGYLERWEFLNAYSGCMIGNPAISLIADAYNKGINKFDMDKAYQYSLRSSELLGNGERGYSTSNSVSSTLEYAYFDWCIAQIAKKLNKKDDEQIFLQKGQAYRNVFDPEVGWFRPKGRDGNWAPWPEKDARIKNDFGCIESNLYQQGWFVPHDIPGMVGLMGGREKVIDDLINFFDKTPDNLMWNSYYNHANEPVHLVPFLFNRLGTPWLTQKWTRHICHNAYFNSVEGLVGNEDVGQMSAWYVLAASGIHPACPGETSYEITSPVFERVTFNLESGKKFTITSHNYLPENIYIQEAKLNGATYNKSFIEYADIASGGHLELYMGNTPNKNWGNAK